MLKDNSPQDDLLHALTQALDSSKCDIGEKSGLLLTLSAALAIKAGCSKDQFASAAQVWYKEEVIKEILKAIKATTLKEKPNER